MSWWDRRMVSFDLETTSADPEEALIVQAAVAFVGGGEVTEEWSVLVDPGIEIPSEAAEIHGITTAHVQENGVPSEVAVPAIFDELKRAEPENWALVIFNAPYDLTVFDRECRRHGIRGGLKVRVVDPFLLDRHLEKYRAGSRKLLDSCRYYGAKLTGAHDATYDAVAAARLAWVLGKRGKIVRSPRYDDEWQELRELEQEWERIRGDLDELHKAQRRWYYSNAVSLEAYFHKGNPKKDVPPQPERVVPRDWPMLPFKPTQEVMDVWD